jgi:hypothetical protein
MLHSRLFLSISVPAELYSQYPIYREQRVAANKVLWMVKLFFMYFVYWNTKSNLQWTIKGYVFTDSNFHNLLYSTTHTVYEYKSSECCLNFIFNIHQ